MKIRLLNKIYKYAPYINVTYVHTIYIWYVEINFHTAKRNNLADGLMRQHEIRTQATDRERERERERKKSPDERKRIVTCCPIFIHSLAHTFSYHSIAILHGERMLFARFSVFPCDFSFSLSPHILPSFLLPCSLVLCAIFHFGPICALTEIKG